jgi:membrane fusion protein, multidrug efflux system
MNRKTSWTWSILAAATGLGMAMTTGCQKAEPPPPPTPPVPVSAATVIQTKMPEETRTFGNVEANLTAAIRSQIGGVLTKVHFKEGQTVKQGDPLFSIDSRPYEATLRLAEANLARDTAQYNNAIKEEAREKELLGRGVVSQGEYDQAKAAADALGAALAADKAAIERARLDIGYCQITAPIDGRAGAWMVDEGNLVKANDIPLVTINQVQPIQVSFAVPQADLGKVQKEAAAHKVVVRVTKPGQENQPEEGTLTFIDNNVNTATGTIMLKATFGNAQERLWPGLFVNVVVILREEIGAVVIPSRAIQTGQEGQYVFVITSDSGVEVRPVKVERTVDERAVITEGLKADERVVTDGQLRLGPKSKVVIKPDVVRQPPTGQNAAPAPTSSQDGAASSATSANGGPRS